MGRTVNTRAKAFFSLILVLLLGIFIGGAVNHLYVSKFSPRQSSGSSNRRPSNRHFPVQEMIERLKLNPDQEKQLLSILERRREDMHKASEDERAAHSAIKKRTRAEIKEMLTEDQYQQFDEFMKELRSRWRNGKAPPSKTPSASERPE